MRKSHFCKPASFGLLLMCGIALVGSSAAAARVYVRGGYARPAYGGYGGGYGGYGGYGYGGGGTVAGNYAHGMADVIRSQGAYNLMTSEASINNEEARSKYIENRQQWTDTYFEMRKTNAAYRDAERAKEKASNPTPDDWIRYAHNAAPKRANDSQLDPVTGEIYWPTQLDGDDYALLRKQLDGMFAQRAQSKGRIGSDRYESIQTATNELLALLMSHITDMAANDYIAAKKFVESLAFEASFHG